MTLRTTAIIAGVLGLVMFLTGWVASAVRDDREVVTQQSLDTPVVVLGPEVLALPGIERIAINGAGALDANTARPVDAEAWLKRHSATYVLGYVDWDELATRTGTRITTPSVAPSPSPDPSGAPTDDAAAADATTEDAATDAAGDGEASPSPAPSADETEQLYDYGSNDLWRHSWRGESRVVVTGATVAAGETLVVFDETGDNLESVEFYAVRDVNDEWISPMMWVGGALALLGVVAALSGLVDIRPIQARVETWQRKRSGVAANPPRPGSRRERRLAGSTLPEVLLDETDTGTVPTIDSSRPTGGGA